MKLGDLLKFSAALTLGAIVLGTGAQAAPVPPAHAAAVTAPANVMPAVVSQKEVDAAKPMQVRWHHHHWHHRHWHHHHWRHHRWHHRWHHRHWRHHH